MRPQITFRHSWLYDNALRRKRSFRMPPEEIFNKSTSRIRREWVKIGPRVLDEIAKITKLRWHKREIIVYLTAGVIPYSDPLTIPLMKSANDMIDTLTHELIHHILSEPENWLKIKKNWSKLMKKYAREPLNTKIHIVVHAIHHHILERFFGIKRLKRQMNMVKDPDYLRSWKIVAREGYENIIKELTTISGR